MVLQFASTNKFRKKNMFVYSCSHACPTSQSKQVQVAYNKMTHVLFSLYLIDPTHLDVFGFINSINILV